MSMPNCSMGDSCYSIYSIGDVDFLFDILNGVAMVTGTGSFTRSCAVAFLLGVITSMLVALFKGGNKLPFSELFLSFLLFSLMFVPKTTVVIEDVYNGRTQMVDNVPLGVAYPGHVISTVGFGLSEIMENAFSSVSSTYGLTKHSFLDSMFILNRIRDGITLDNLWKTIDLKIGDGSDARSSWINFMSDCMLLEYKFNEGNSAQQDYMRSYSELLTHGQSKIYGTEIYRNGAQLLNCSEAQELLINDLKNITTQDLNLLSTSSNGNNLGAIPDDLDEHNSISYRLNNALTFLGVSASSELDIVKASLLEPIYNRASQGYFASTGDVMTSLSLNQALIQRNTQWALEQSMFMTTVRPFVTFFEGLVYAITPFIAILICIGVFGIRVGIRYFQTLVWLQLWMPILSIINLYILKGVKNEITESVGNVPFDSFYALDTADNIIQNWIATAGMLAASTPILAFFLVSGSAYTFTAITGKMSGGDHIDEKIVSPDLIKQSPVLTSSAGSSQFSNSGLIGSGRESQLSSISLSQELTESSQNLASKVKVESNALNKSVQNAWTSAINGSEGISASTQLGHIVSNLSSSSATKINSIADNIAQSFGLSSSQRDMVASSITQSYLASNGQNLNITAIASGNAMGVDLSFGGGASANSGKSANFSGSNASSFEQSKIDGSNTSANYSIGISNAEQETLSDGITSQTLGQKSSTYLKNFSTSEQESIAKQSSKVESLQNSYSESIGLSSRIGNGVTLNQKEGADAILNSGLGNEVIKKSLNMSQTERNNAKTEQLRLMKSLGMDAEHAKIAGILIAATNGGSSVASSEITNLLAKSVGFNGSPNQRPHGSLSNVDDLSIGSTNSGVQSNLQRIQSQTDSINGSLTSSFATKNNEQSNYLTEQKEKGSKGFISQAESNFLSMDPNYNDPTKTQFALWKNSFDTEGKSVFDVSTWTDTATSCLQQISGGGDVNVTIPQTEQDYIKTVNKAIANNNSLSTDLKQMLMHGSINSQQALDHSNKPIHQFKDGSYLSVKEKNYFDRRGISYDSDHAEHFHRHLKGFYQSAWQQKNLVNASSAIQVLQQGEVADKYRN